MCNPRPEKQLQMVHCYSPKPSLNLQVDNKQLKRTGAIVLCSVDLFDSTPDLGFSFAFDVFDDNGDKRKSLCTKRSRLLDRVHNL